MKRTGTDYIRLDRILVVASVVVPALLLVIVLWQDYRSVVRETERDVIRTADIFHRHSLNVFETHQLIAEAVNSFIMGLTWNDIERSRSVHNYLRNLQDRYPQVQAIWLADAAGRVS